MKNTTVDFLPAFEAVPGNNILLSADAPTFNILAVTAGYLSNTGRTKDEMIGKGLFEVSVQDFGIGISLKEHKNVFEQFCRVNVENQSKFPGIGIGLHLLRNN